MFQFKQFSIRQDLCAMKVGTDGVLLGAWASGGRRILDVGTGTGVIALMMAQRFPDAQVTAIDIDEDAVRQAQANVAASPFSNRVVVLHSSLQDFCSPPSDILHHPSDILPSSFSSIVSNPPFFVNALKAPDRQRSVARHADTLTFTELMQGASRLLADDGELSVIIPFDYRRRMEDEALFAGFFPSRLCAVRTTDSKPPRRYLLAFRKHPCPLQREELTIASDAYRRLTHDFYLDTQALQALQPLQLFLNDFC